MFEFIHVCDLDRRLEDGSEVELHTWVGDDAKWERTATRLDRRSEENVVFSRYCD